MLESIYTCDDDDIEVDYSNWNISYKITYMHLGPGTVHFTDIPQSAETALLDYVSELNKDFLWAKCDMLDSYLYNKGYDIAECVLTEALCNEYRLSSDSTKDAIVESIVNSIDFSKCYEIINCILEIPQTCEEYLIRTGIN